MNDVEQQEAAPTGNTAPNKPAGPFIGIIIIVLVLVLGGIYFWGQQVSQEMPSVEEIQNAPDEALNVLETQGASDELNAIEEDLSATEIDGLDAELQDIESELGNF